MTRGQAFTFAAGISLTVAAGLVAAAKAQPGSRAAAPFTDAQAAAGRLAYAQHCSACHGETLSGSGEAPPLAGPALADSWGARTTRDLLTHTRESMPPQNPNGLGAATYADIVAFVLSANGAQAGKELLTPARSKGSVRRLS